MAREASGITEYLLPPLPNTLYTRDTTCWIYGGVTLNPLYWPVRREETLLMAAIYRFHPSFAHAEFEVWWGNPEENYRSATLEGGDVQAAGREATEAAAVGLDREQARAISNPAAKERDRSRTAPHPRMTRSRSSQSADQNSGDDRAS